MWFGKHGAQLENAKISGFCVLPMSVLPFHSSGVSRLATNTPKLLLLCPVLTHPTTAIPLERRYTRRREPLRKAVSSSSRRFPGHCPASSALLARFSEVPELRNMQCVQKSHVPSPIFMRGIQPECRRWPGLACHERFVDLSLTYTRRHQVRELAISMAIAPISLQEKYIFRVYYSKYS
jgi:hypothetical protein